jgi:hypothetical protein
MMDNRALGLPIFVAALLLSIACGSSQSDQPASGGGSAGASGNVRASGSGANGGGAGHSGSGAANGGSAGNATAGAGGATAGAAGGAGKGGESAGGATGGSGGGTQPLLVRRLRPSAPRLAILTVRHASTRIALAPGAPL